MRHLQDAQLRKVHGAAYDAAHAQYQQRAAASLSSAAGAGAVSPLGGGRQLQQGAANSRLQQLLANSQPATLRISPVLQLQDSYLSTQQAAQLRDVLVPGAVRVLQQYIKVRFFAVKTLFVVHHEQKQQQPHGPSCASAAAAAAHQQQCLPPAPHRVCCAPAQVRLPASRPVKAVREPMDQYCGEANADAVFKGEWVWLQQQPARLSGNVWHPHHCVLS